MAIHQLNEILYQSRFTAPAMKGIVDLLLGNYEEKDINDVELYHMIITVFDLENSSTNNNPR